MVWDPPQELAAAEVLLLKLCKKQKFWGFLRTYRHVILDDEVRGWLAESYSSKPRGSEPVAPERLLLAMLLQVAFDVADQDVPVLTSVDRRWQMILDLDSADSAAFSQGSVFNFRERLRESGVMSRILDKTVRIARETGGYSHTRLRALIDSSPLLGAGRVEDTFNLLGRAIVDLLACSAKTSARTVDEVIDEAQLLPLTSASIKAVLDVDWTQDQARTLALNVLLEQFERLNKWIRATLGDEVNEPPLSEKIGFVEALIEQDTEPDPDPPAKQPGARRVKNGGTDRVISVADKEMRHGRKSSTKGFAGYKRHVAVDADLPGLVVAVHIDPGNRREYDGAAPLLAKIDHAGFDLVEAHFDRGYLPSLVLNERRLGGMRAISKPPVQPTDTKYFPKTAFDIDFESKKVSCPAGEVTDLRTRSNGRPAASFSNRVCGSCALREECVRIGTGRSVAFHRYEDYHRSMAAELKTSEGRAMRRKRIPVEHALARIGAIQGRRSRFRGLAKNQFDLERTAVVTNLFAIARLMG